MKNILDKMRSRGVESLEDNELLALLIDDVSIADEALDMANNTMKEFGGSIANVLRQDISRLRMVSGMGRRRAERLKLASELGRRLAIAETTAYDRVESDKDVVRIMQPQLGSLKHEECWVLYLTSSNRVIERMRISQGGVQATVVDCRLVVKRALELLSTRIILTHNHPSGSPTPSPQDITLTEKIRQASQLFDIELMDHIIISATDSYSLRANGQLR